MHKTHTLFWVMSFLGVLLFFTVVPPVHAADPLLPKPTGSCPDTKEGTSRQCVDGLCSGTNIPCNYSLQDIQNTAVGIGNWIFGIIGIVVLVLFIYGGFLWLISAGNSENVNKGKSIMVGSVIGILLVFGAGTIVKIFLKAIGADPQIAAGLPIGGTGATTAGPTSAPPKPVYACSCTTPDNVIKTCGDQLSGKPDGLGLNEFLCLANFKEYIEKNYALTPELLKGTTPAEFAAKKKSYLDGAKCKVVLKKNC